MYIPLLGMMASCFEEKAAGSFSKKTSDTVSRVFASSY